MIRHLSLGIALCAIGAQASAQISFNGPVNYATGPQSDATAAGDFNNDGRLDLATSSDQPDKVVIFTNNGAGAFSQSATVQTGGGTSPHTPVAGDLDGDGDVDIAVSLKNTNQVRILVNNGGAFTLGPVFSVGAEPRTMAIADIDNDGDLDLAVSNRSGNTVSVLRNGGSLAFTVQSYQAGIQPRSIALGDVTGDGLADLAIAAHDSSAVIVLGNIGGGAFAPIATINLGNKPEGIAIARFNGDALNDIATTVSNNNLEFVSVILSLGNGAFGGPNSFPTGGLDSGFIAAADLDNDGDTDVATANTDSANISLLAGNGLGGLGAAQQIGVGTEPSHVIAATLDANSSPDLVVTNEASANISVLLNQSSGNGCDAHTYCQAKLTSIGTLPSIGFTGTPSVSAQNFVITLSNGAPNKPSLGLFSQTGASNSPFQGGTLCLAAPVQRLPGQLISAQGTAAYSIPVSGPMVGTSRWFQFWFRDTQASFGSGLSNGLSVTFCQ
ncbi:MAG TPA: VCBS repeat-containing protein [Planctomycetota bacterium]|nr:VCBS repeat-containing protein [Planctomycetota bacterium]